MEAREWDATITIDVLWDAIENVASHAELRVSVANIHQILPPDADPAGEWRSAVEFGATTDAALVTSFMPLQTGQDLETDLDVEESSVSRAKLLTAVREFGSYFQANTGRIPNYVKTGLTGAAVGTDQHVLAIR
jgi:hypothetical protein